MPSSPNPESQDGIRGSGEFSPLSQYGRGAGGEGKTHTVRRFQMKLTPMGNAVPLHEIYMYQGFSEMV
ncbi:hypothetical protein [Nostoc sp.]|uniref:hypothetical protein n=1 Tax=Nostoc sp. TaxID=1180 RepID=UPI002FF8DFB5